MPSGIFLEAVRCILGSKESGMTLGESTATVILHRVLYIVGFLASTSLAFMVLILGGRVTTSVIFQLAAVPVLAVAGLIASLFLSLNPKIMQPLLDRALRLVQPVIKIVQKQAKNERKGGPILE